MAQSTTDTLSPPHNQAARDNVLRGFRRSDAIFRALTHASAIGVLCILGGVFVALIGGAIPTLREFGLAFFYVDDWNPVTDNYGAVAPIPTAARVRTALATGSPSRHEPSGDRR